MSKNKNLKVVDWVNHEEFGLGLIGDHVAYDTYNPDRKIPKEDEVLVFFRKDEKTEFFTTKIVNKDSLTPNDICFPAKDQRGEKIVVGSKILYPMTKGGAGNAACIKEGKVEGIEQPTHRGYGYWTRKLKIRDNVSKKLITHNYPANCIKMTGV
jgi:hypothetical protein